MALCTGHAGPQQGARVALPEVSRVGLLSRPDPNCPLLRLLHVNILISNVLNDGHLILVHVPKLHVDAFISAIHVNIPKGDVRHHILAALRANREAKAAGLNILEQHVAGAAFHGEAIILVPNLTVVHPHVGALQVPAVRVEGPQVPQVVASAAVAAVQDVGVSDFQAVHLGEPGGPVWRVGKQQLFHQHILHHVHFPQPRPVLLVLQIPKVAPPCNTLAVQGAPLLRREGHVAHVLEAHAGQNLSADAWPRLLLVRELQGAINADHHMGQIVRLDASHEVEGLARNLQHIPRTQSCQALVQQGAILPLNLLS
mmetsp:Transcript_62608/g.149326  ORF Transcript_62608/g.149326 Transcript_62608/m.149326 type:complete len:313 (-) Transcript_62608:120-1058(-)